MASSGNVNQHIVKNRIGHMYGVIETYRPRMGQWHALFFLNGTLPSCEAVYAEIEAHSRPNFPTDAAEATRAHYVFMQTLQQQGRGLGCSRPLYVQGESLRATIEHLSAVNTRSLVHGVQQRRLALALTLLCRLCLTYGPARVRLVVWYIRSTFP